MQKDILKMFLAASLLFLCRPAHALVELHAEVWTDSEKISPSLIVPEDTWTDVETDTLTVRLRASKAADGRAEVQAEILRSADGAAPVMLGKPSLKMNWNESAEIAARKDDGNLMYRLRVIATQMEAKAPAPAAAAK